MDEIIESYERTYIFGILTEESAHIFLKSKGYILLKGKSYENGGYRNNDIVECVTLHAIKNMEEDTRPQNEVDRVFSREFQEALLSLLINSKEISYYEEILKLVSK